MADAPFEVVHVECASSDAAACRKALEAGLDFVPCRRDNVALVEFQDGLLAKVRFHAAPERPRHYLVTPGDLAYPLEAWPKGQAPQLLSVNCDGLVRRFATPAELRDAPERLDLATIEEAFSCTTRGGGLGGHVSASPAELRRAVERLEEVVASFSGPAWAARRARLGHFLDHAKQATEDHARWEELLAGHQLFREAVDSIVRKRLDGLRSEVRQKILEEEAGLRDRLAALEVECGDWEGLARSAREEAEQLRQDVEGLSGQRETAVAELDRLRTEREGGKCQANASRVGENGAVRSEVAAQAIAAPSAPARFSFAPDPITGASDLLKTSKEALKRLEDNLHALGIMKVSARLLGREALVALSLGQMVFFRGSMGSPVAEVCAASLAGGRVQTASVPLGASQPFEVPHDPGEGPKAILLEGVNRSCFETYCESIAALLRGRALGKSPQPWPLFFGTLGNGPSFLPPGPELIAFGPVFDTDCLSWDMKRTSGEIKPARCEPGALELKEGAEPEDWPDLIEELFAAGNILWERQARAALRRLVALAEPDRAAQASASFLFGWVLPRLLASDLQPAAFAERFGEGILHEAVGADQRVKRLLHAHGVGEGE
jgi:hypothetical protein